MSGCESLEPVRVIFKISESTARKMRNTISNELVPTEEALDIHGETPGAWKQRSLRGIGKICILLLLVLLAVRRSSSRACDASSSAQFTAVHCVWCKETCKWNKQEMAYFVQ
jgi:hypothetical protein